MHFDWSLIKNEKLGIWNSEDNRNTLVINNPHRRNSSVQRKKRICHIHIFHYYFAFKLGWGGNVQVFLLVKCGDLIPWNISTFVFIENHSEVTTTVHKLIQGPSGKSVHWHHMACMQENTTSVFLN